MFITNVLLKKVKSKHIMVLMESVVSGHQCTKIRERLADKLELKIFDPYIQHESLYKERKKIRSMKSNPYMATAKESQRNQPNTSSMYKEFTTREGLPWRSWLKNIPLRLSPWMSYKPTKGSHLSRPRSGFLFSIIEITNPPAKHGDYGKNPPDLEKNLSKSGH